MTLKLRNHVFRSGKKLPCWSGWSMDANCWLTGDLRFDFLDAKQPCITPFVKDNWDYFCNPWMHEVDPHTIHLVPTEESDKASASYIVNEVCNYLKDEPEALEMFQKYKMFEVKVRDSLYIPNLPVPHKENFWQNNIHVRLAKNVFSDWEKVVMGEELKRTLRTLGLLTSGT